MTTFSCILVKNRGVCSIDSGSKYQSSGRSAAEKSIKSTIFKGLTIKLIPDKIKTLLTIKMEDYNYDII
jgi:hypothetical protein